MNKFINNILEENKGDVHDDPFFKPKDIKKKEEKIKEKRQQFLPKIKLGLKNIKRNYKNKNWDSKEEELFLKIFSQLHLNKEYRSMREGYVLKNEHDEIKCFFDLKNDTFWVSYKDMWWVFKNSFDLNYYGVQSFIKQMLNDYFKLYEFTILFSQDDPF